MNRALSRHGSEPHHLFPGGLNLASLSFRSVLGKPKFIKRTSQADCAGFTYLMPKTKENSMNILIGLSIKHYNIRDQDPIEKQFAKRLE